MDLDTAETARSWPLPPDLAGSKGVAQMAAPAAPDEPLTHVLSHPFSLHGATHQDWAG